MRKALAWLVHLYTAMGLVCAAGIAILIVRGGDGSFRRAFMLMAIATAIDATDGWFARRAQVKTVLPEFDGAALDNLIDFLNYTSLPLLLVWRSEMLPGALEWLLLLALFASAYGFSQTNAKTDDGFFLGFPSYWNIAAFYLYLIQPPVWISAALITVCALLTFVPTPYVSSTRGGPLAKTMNVGAVVYFVLIGAVLMADPANARILAIVSLAYPALYLALSAHVTRKSRSVSTSGRAGRAPARNPSRSS